MPEVILPCPAWACQGELVESKQDGENFFIECTECGMRGPVPAGKASVSCTPFRQRSRAPASMSRH